MSWLTFIVLIGVVWRVTRFITKDDLIEGTRKKVLAWLEKWKAPDDPDYRKGLTTDLLAFKAWTLLTCPWCVSIYISAATLVAYRIFVDDVPMPIFMWLAIAGFSLVPYNYLDGED
jgi:hypothetical protein